MKIKNILYSLAGVALAAAATACEGEKDLIIIDGDLPIKTSTLYMVGDATPNGWSIDAPTPFEALGEDPLVFSWEGSLRVGEMKLCLTTGSWDAPFIRPQNNGETLSKEPVNDAKFDMHAGDPDNKWKIGVAGKYRLTFDLRNWTMSSAYVGEPDAPKKEPIATDVFYIVGSATPSGWNIDAPTPLEKKSAYIFEYEGMLNGGELKACASTGSWDVPFVRPASDGVKIGKDGVESADFVYTTAPDDKWAVQEAGLYHLTFDLEHYTITAELKEAVVPDKTPIETATVFMIGDATPNGWSMDNATEFTAESKYIFKWEGMLVEGNMKACIEKDPNFACPFIRPEAAGVEIGENGVAAPGFVFTTGPDDQWKIVKAGNYAITLDLEHYTITAEYKDGKEPDTPGREPIEAAAVYMIGDATPNGWSMDNATQFTAEGKYIFKWEGRLAEGNMKACIEKDPTFACPFIRPEAAGVEIGENGVSAPGFVFTTEPDDQWRVVKAGTYRLTLDLEHYTIAAEFVSADIPGGDDKKPIESNTLYMIGDATPNGWSMDNPTALTQSSTDKYVFTWTGMLGTGDMKACLQPDGTFSCPFLRPAKPGVKIDASGVEAPEFVYTTDPDDKWRVEKAGKYTITFNLKNWTIEAKYLD